MSRALFSLLLVAPLAAGCVTLLPKNRPAQLYRFEAAAPQSPTGPAPITLTIDRVVLPAASEGDGILTVRGDVAAYVEGARWLSPAALLFREAVIQGLMALGYVWFIYLHRFLELDTGDATQTSVLATEALLRTAPHWVPDGAWVVLLPNVVTAIRLALRKPAA